MLTTEQIKKLYAKALAAQTAGRLDEAAKGYARIIKANPKVAEAHFNIARVFAKKRNIPDAARHFEAALQLRPGQPEIWLAYLDMASRHPNIDNLAKLLTRASALRGAHPEMDFYHGLVAARRGDSAGARAAIERAVAGGLVSARAQTELGVLLAGAAESDAAIRAFDEALRLKPGYDYPLARKADLMRNLGDYDTALDLARQAIEAAPNVAQLYYSYASIRKMQPDDPMIGKMKALLNKLAAKDPGRAHLGHALAKAMEDTGQQGEVFRYLDIANRSAAKAFPYDHGSDAAAVTETRQRFEGLTGAHCPPARRGEGPTPIFVTGMPRSGTTLVEQIISSHSRCEGAGELGLLSKEFQAAFQSAGDDMPALCDALGAAGARYRDMLAARFPDAAYVTDKSISSYGAIGFIRHALPDARIVVVRRDPADNALSIYKNMFAGGQHRYATDLRNIARFYKLFEAQVAFWERHCPDAFAQIRYEDLIADPEGQSRQLIAAAGLEWEDACLSFYDNKRQVDTLSTTQVRQPIYNSSVGAWRRHEAAMAPFIEEFAAE